MNWSGFGSDNYGESVISQSYSVRQHFLYLLMYSEGMADVGQVGFGGIDFPGQLQCFFQGKMGNVLFVTQCIDYQNLTSPDFFELGAGNGIDIGKVGEFAGPEAQHRKFVMITPDGDKVCPVNTEKLVRYIMQFHLRNPGVFPRCKNIVKDSPDGHMDPVFRIYIRWLFLKPVESPDVIKSENMIHVFMGEEDRPQPLNFMGEHLLPEIGTRVDQEIAPIYGEQGRGSQPFVPCVGGSAYRTLTADQRNPL